MSLWDSFTYSSDSARLNLGTHEVRLSNQTHRTWRDLLNLGSFNMHVRLPKREGVDIRGGVQVCETVVYKSVGGLVRPNRIQYVEKLRIWTQTPIIDGNFRSFEIGPKLF